MTKKITSKTTKETPNKGEGKDLSQEKAEAAAKEEAGNLEKVAKAVQAALETHNYGLQPYLMMSEMGIIPSVRLAKMSEKEEKK